MKLARSALWMSCGLALNGTTNLGKGDLTSAGDDDAFVAQFAP